MTREEAINHLGTYRFRGINHTTAEFIPAPDVWQEALEMAIDALREQETVTDSHQFETVTNRNGLIRLESDTVKVVDSDQFNRWISVEERLPEIEMHGTSRVVLAWEPDHGRCFAMVYDNGQGKRWFSGGVEIPKITHWMPLPEPPEVEG